MRHILVLLAYALSISLCFSQTTKKRLSDICSGGFQCYYLCDENGFEGAETKDGKTIIPTSKGFDWVILREQGYFSVEKAHAVGAYDIWGREIIAPKEEYKMIIYTYKEGFLYLTEYGYPAFNIFLDDLKRALKPMADGTREYLFGPENGRERFDALRYDIKGHVGLCMELTLSDQFLGEGKDTTLCSYEFMEDGEYVPDYYEGKKAKTFKRDSQGRIVYETYESTDEFNPGTYEENFVYDSRNRIVKSYGKEPFDFSYKNFTRTYTYDGDNLVREEYSDDISDPTVYTYKVEKVDSHGNWTIRRCTSEDNVLGSRTTIQSRSFVYFPQDGKSALSQNNCTSCNGTGKCYKCKGKKKYMNTDFGILRERRCGICNETGACTKCGGTGRR